MLQELPPELEDVLGWAWPEGCEGPVLQELPPEDLREAKKRSLQQAYDADDEFPEGWGGSSASSVLGPRPEEPQHTEAPDQRIRKRLRTKQPEK